MDYNKPKRFQREDIAALIRYLSATAYSWVPSMFPEGRKLGMDWRVGSVKGEKGSSMSIRLSGIKAGYFIDHADSDGTRGTPLELIKLHYNCTFKQAVLEAQKIVGGDIRPEVRVAKIEAENELRDIKRVMKIWDSRRTLKGTIAQDYLWKRGLTSYPNDVFYHDSLYHYPSEKFLPAMIAAIKNQKNDIIGIHRTFLSRETLTKAKERPNKMILGNARGGCVKLFPANAGVLGICEGIETGIAARQLFDIPVWAALSTSGLINMEPVVGITHYKIFADDDEAGHKAAKILQEKLRPVSISAEIILPTVPGCKDFNDQLFCSERKA